MKRNNIFSLRHVATEFPGLTLALAGTTATRASDLAREQRLAEQIVDAIPDRVGYAWQAGHYEERCGADNPPSLRGA